MFLLAFLLDSDPKSKLYHLFMRLILSLDLKEDIG